MNKDELKFLNDFCSKHHLNLLRLLLLVGMGANKSIELAQKEHCPDMIDDMIDIDTDVSRFTGIIPLAEDLSEGGDDIE